jgi:hypothetical protein
LTKIPTSIEGKQHGRLQLAAERLSSSHWTETLMFSISRQSMRASYSV